MLSKSQVSFIKSLHQKKFRRQHGLFIVEGIKSISDFLASDFNFHSIYFTTEYAKKFDKDSTNIKLFEVNHTDIEKISALQQPQGVIALINLPVTEIKQAQDFSKRITLVIDDVQDPGNLGTIIRTADWFGIHEIVCSSNTTDAFNPKTVQATMGSLARVKIYYTHLPAFLKQQTLPKYGAFLAGENIYHMHWQPEGFIVVGNEGNGISTAVEATIDQKITIPRIGAAESLNVAISTAIICNEWTRNRLYKKTKE